MRIGSVRLVPTIRLIDLLLNLSITDDSWLLPGAVRIRLRVLELSLPCHLLLIEDVQLLLQLPVVLACLYVLRLVWTLDQLLVVSLIRFAHILLRLDHVHDIDVLIHTFAI